MRYIVKYETFKDNSEILNESLTQGLVTDALQFLLGAGAEYVVGGAVAVGTVGAGTPVGPVLETIVDCGFASEAILSTINQVTQLKGQFGEFADIINKCMESYETFKSGDLKKFYEQVRQIIIDGLETLKKGEETVDKVAEKIRDILSKLISKITDAVTKGLKILIPDATIGLGLSSAIKVVVEVASDNGYTIARKSVEKLGQYKKYLIDPKQFPLLIQKAIPEVYKIIDGFKKKIEEVGWAKSVIMFGSYGLILKKLGPSGLDKLKQTLKDFVPKVLDLIEKILTIVLPVTFTFLAIIQILLKGEYKKVEQKSQKNQKK